MKDKICGIYKIQCNINDKSYIYIGKSIDIERRWNEHNHELLENKHCNKFMQRIYNKYGNDVFIYEIIEKCDEHLLNNKEIEYISSYKNNDDIILMNMTDGGDGGNTYKYLSYEKLEKIKNKKREWTKENHKISEYGKIRISIANSHPKSEEAKSNMKLAWKRRKEEGKISDIRGEKNPMYGVHRYGRDNPMYGRVGILSPRYGVKHTEESKKKMSESRKGKYLGEENPNYGNHLSNENKKKISDKNSKTILCLDLKYNIVESYKNNKECTLNNSYNHYNYISYNHKIKNIRDAKICKENLIFIYEEDYMKIKGGDE